MNTLLADQQPLAPPVFPLPDASVRHGARTFKAYVGEELQAIATGNLDALPDDSAIRYLLEGKARPYVPADEPTHAYQAGVCMGAALVRRRARLLAEAGHPAKEADFDPANGPTFGAASELVRKWVPEPLKSMLQQEAHGNEVYVRPAEFFVNPEAIAYIGVLKVAWIRQGVGFLRHESILRGDDDYFTIGLGDALSTLAGLCQSEDAPRRKSLRYRPRKHILKLEKDLAAKGVAIEWAFDEGILDESTADPLEGFGAFRMASGYRANTRNEQATGSVRRGSKDTWWSNEVAVGDTVVDVRRFMETTVFIDPAKSTGHGEVGLRKTVEAFRLGKQDRLIIQNNEGQLMGIGYPFRVEQNLLGGETGQPTVRILSLCRRGEAFPLVDRDHLDKDVHKALEAITGRILERQQVERYNRAAAFLLDKVLPHSTKAAKVLPALTGPAGVLLAEGFASQTVAGLALGLGTSGLLKLAQRIGVFRRESASSPEVTL